MGKEKALNKIEYAQKGEELGWEWICRVVDVYVEINSENKFMGVVKATDRKELL